MLVLVPETKRSTDMAGNIVHSWVGCGTESSFDSNGSGAANVGNANSRNNVILLLFRNGGFDPLALLP